MALSRHRVLAARRLSEDAQIASAGAEPWLALPRRQGENQKRKSPSEPWVWQKGLQDQSGTKLVLTCEVVDYVCVQDNLNVIKLPTVSMKEEEAMQAKQFKDQLQGIWEIVHVEDPVKGKVVVTEALSSCA